MIRVYYLKVTNVNGTEICAGSENIHHAVLGCTEKPDIRELIQNTTDIEHKALIAVTESWREATKDEGMQLSHISTIPPEPVRDLAKEIDELKVKVTALEK